MFFKKEDTVDLENLRIGNKVTFRGGGTALVSRVVRGESYFEPNFNVMFDFYTLEHVFSRYGYNGVRHNSCFNSNDERKTSPFDITAIE